VNRRRRRQRQKELDKSRIQKMKNLLASCHPHTSTYSQLDQNQKRAVDFIIAISNPRYIRLINS